MKIVKITSMLVLLMSFIACKKDSVAPQQKNEPFDIRKYVLVTKKTNSSGWVEDIRLTSFEAQSKSIIFTEGGNIPDDGFNYSYDNGILKLFYGLSLQNELKIENKNITSTTESVAGKFYKLIEIPTDNPLNGNTYAGGWKAEGSLVTTVASLKFTDTHYSEASFNLPVPNKTYALFKNIAAFKYDATDRVMSFWLFSDGKVEGYRKYYTTNNRVTGTFIKQ